MYIPFTLFHVILYALYQLVILVVWIHLGCPPSSLSIKVVATVTTALTMITDDTNMSYQYIRIAIMEDDAYT